MRKFIAAAVVVAACATAAACSQARGEGAGPTVSRTYPIGIFQKIEVAGPYDVEVRTGANPGVSAQGSQTLLDRTVVEVKGDRLLIHPREEHGFHFGWSNSGKANFIVTVPHLSGASIAGSGGVRVDQVQGDSFEGDVAGSGGLDVASLAVNSLKFSIAGSGGIKAGTGRVQTAEYEIGGSGGI